MFDNLQLHIEFVVTGAHLHRVIWPQATSNAGERHDNLWQHSCFECFVAQRHESDYYEFNFSPSKNWAFYHFQSYRAYKTSPPLENSEVSIQFDASGDKVTCNAKLKHGLTILPADLGVSCVIETMQGMYYFALSHEEAKPDFHQRRSFNLLFES